MVQILTRFKIIKYNKKRFNLNTPLKTLFEEIIKRIKKDYRIKTTHPVTQIKEDFQ